MSKSGNFQNLNQETELNVISPNSSSSDNLNKDISLTSNLKSLNENITNNNSLDTNQNINSDNDNINSSRNETASLNSTKLNISRNTENRNKNTNYKNLLKKQKLIFIPIISAKIIIPGIYMNLYISDSFDYEIDKQYFDIAIWIFISIIFYFYYLCIYTPNKQSNVNKYFDNQINNVLNIHILNPGNEIQSLNPEFWNDCAYCNHSKKFIRSSHCRTCNKCVLLRDHHCPYIGNCVGYDNMQYFTNFIFLGMFGMIFFIILCINYYFSKNEKVINFKMPLIPKIILIIDLIMDVLTVLSLLGLLMSQFLNIFNNCMKLERTRNPLLEMYSPCCNNCINNILYVCNDPYANIYNIGYLANLYYIFGPTLCHYFLPLPKYYEFTLKENNPIFLGAKIPDRLSIFKFLSKKDNNYANLLEQDDCNPDHYIKLCHKFYDNKKIV